MGVSAPSLHRESTDSLIVLGFQNILSFTSYQMANCSACAREHSRNMVHHCPCLVIKPNGLAYVSSLVLLSPCHVTKPNRVAATHFCNGARDRVGTSPPADFYVRALTSLPYSFRVYLPADVVTSSLLTGSFFAGVQGLYRAVTCSQVTLLSCSLSKQSHAGTLF